MRTNHIYPDAKPPVQSVDFTDLEQAGKAMCLAAEELARMAPQVAEARTCKEFSVDRRKRSLALAVREYLSTESATASETMGRASIGYGEALEQQRDELLAAEQVLASYEAVRCKWESARSTLSALRHIAGAI